MRLPRHLPAILGTAAAALVGLAIVFFVFVLATSKLYRMPSSSMEPTFHCAEPGNGCLAKKADRIVVWKPLYWFGGPERGDVVAFKTPPEAEARCGAGGTFVKRIVGLPGEAIEERLISGRGHMFVDGKRLSEPYVEDERRDSQSYGPFRIPAGRYFLMGDSRSQSCDSREWGPVPRKDIIGKVFFVYLPLSRFGSG